MQASDNTLNKINSFATEKPKDYSILKLQNKIYTKVNNSLEIKKFDEEFYFDEILKVIEEYNILSSISENEEDDENIHKKFIHKIGHINDLVLLPNEYKYLVRETRLLLSKIRKGKFSTGLNSNLAPWSISSLRKLLEYSILDEENLSMIHGNWVNMQEWVRFVKNSTNWHEEAITHFDTLDKIEKIDISIWDNSSIAHWVVFQAKNIQENIFEYTLKTWENVFLGINTQIHSWVQVGDNTSIWWGTIIKDDVKIWNNVVIWAWVILDSQVQIPDNCLIPNWAIIEKDFEIISYSEYKKNELDCDTKKIGKRDRRNFIIELDQTSKEERIKQMNSINRDYSFISNFNEEDVVPENKIFSVINVFLAMIDKKFPNLWVLREEEFMSSLTLEQVKYLVPEMEEELIKNELKRPVKLSLKSFPKDKDKFLTELIPKLIKAIRNKEDITEEIKSYLDFPEIPENKEQVFLGTNIITWKAKIDEKSFIYDTYIRSDELQMREKVQFINSVSLKWTFHWWGNKILKDSKIISLVSHWKAKIYNSKLWNYKHHSVYNNCEINKVIQESGWVVANGVNITNSIIGFAALLMPGAKIYNSTIEDYVIIWNREIQNCTIRKNTYIWNWDEALIWTYLSWKMYSIDKEKYSKHINHYWLEGG